MEIGVDQVTITLFPNLMRYCADLNTIHLDSIVWSYAVNDIIKQVDERLMLTKTMGADFQHMEKGKTHGYNSAVSVGCYDIVLCWHSSVARHDMGLSLRLGATDWHIYRDNWHDLYGSEMTFWQFWDMLSSPYYNKRISRIDIAVDYYNYPGISPDILYTRIEDESIVVLTDDGRMPCRTRRGFTADGVCETLEVGSRHSDCFLVCYDKRLQSIRLHGPRYNTAIECKSWLRTEARFRNGLAHAIGDDMTNITDDKMYKAYLAQKVVERFGFYQSGREGL